MVPSEKVAALVGWILWHYKLLRALHFPQAPPHISKNFPACGWEALWQKILHADDPIFSLLSRFRMAKWSVVHVIHYELGGFTIMVCCECGCMIGLLVIRHDSLIYILIIPESPEVGHDDAMALDLMVSL